jgi:uncharacterized membrane protein
MVGRHLVQIGSAWFKRWIVFFILQFFNIYLFENWVLQNIQEITLTSTESFLVVFL